MHYKILLNSFLLFTPIKKWCILAESDNESASSVSPVKNRANQRVVKVKTLEEIKLEQIQAESAAYYSYSGE